ncbi:MAG: DUF2207 domain-containing protein [Clostridia bacterium]|nr:DUF2207 domain-containing protein [Clostridia bacterium]
MKKIRRLPLIFAALVLLLFACIFAFSGGGQKAYAYGAYDYQFDKYHITYDIRSDRTMDVCIDFDVHYLGYQSTGLLYDIPVNAGDRVRNIKAYELDEGGNENFLLYRVKNEESDLVTVDMGDHSRKTDEVHSYRLKFSYAITKPAKNEKNALNLNVVGFGFEKMSDVFITVNLPDGFIKEKSVYYTGWRGAGNNTGYTDWNFEGNTITLAIDRLAANHGVTFAVAFENGVLTTKPDLMPYWIIIGACVLLGILFAVKFLIFNKDGLTPVVNTEAPNDMDPLAMGKLIDNKVNKSDVTSLIYYWANKGYLKINMEDESNVELIRIRTELPANAPKYQRTMYAGLFKGGDSVKINSLTDSFYRTVDVVTREVNAEHRNLYSKTSITVAAIFSLVGALVTMLTPVALGMLTISLTYISLLPLFMIVPAFIIFALAQTVKYYSLKLKKGKLALLYAGVALLSLAFSGIYMLLVPSHVIELLPKFLICVVTFTMVILSTTIISRTEAYNEKLNHIVGFREFILTAEKDKLETMLEQNPEFYYQVLPYANVLGVSDVWENKFAALTVVPPSWTTSSYHNSAFNFIVFNSAMRSASRNMTTSFISRPSSGSYSGGGSHGGHFGGFSGGGHGGGGARGR